ncbi:MAG: exodeoxyribonuclease VII large subunit [Porphyromonadaceae bacterium]|nr:exodeoxyribonuclease VII large subunit [Porphyromonadaceae bacterium]
MDKSYSLFEFCSSIRRCLQYHYSGKYWIHAEICDLRVNKGSGYCYFDLIQKGDDDRIVARSKATIWSNKAQELLPKFHRETGSVLQNGLEVMLLVSVNFHEQFGFSLNVDNIDPTYTLGEMARKRREIVERLQREGLLDRNKELPLPRIFQRLAVITSATAAGWGDFVNHLNDTPESFVFYTHLYPASMQGKDTESSIVKALSIIEGHKEHFDAVVIIRGGGAQSELASFDSYLLAKECALFPLPIISGIGHERDISVVDMVASISLKTPTAVADFLIERMRCELSLQQDMMQRLKLSVSQLQSGYSERIDRVAMRLPVVAQFKLRKEGEKIHLVEKMVTMGAGRLIENASAQITSISSKLPTLISRTFDRSWQMIGYVGPRLRIVVGKRMGEMSSRLEVIEKTVSLSDPRLILSKGFAIVSSQDKICCHAKELKSGSKVEMTFIDGVRTATVD